MGIGDIIWIYELIIVSRIFLSWIPHNREHPAVVFLYKATEPVLEPVRRVIPPIGGFDISPLVVFFFLAVIAKIFS